MDALRSVLLAHWITLIADAFWFIQNEFKVFYNWASEKYISNNYDLNATGRILTEEHQVKVILCALPNLVILLNLLWCIVKVSLLFLNATASWAWRWVTRIPDDKIAYVTDSRQHWTSKFKYKHKAKHIMMENLNSKIISEKVLTEANDEARKIISNWSTRL